MIPRKDFASIKSRIAEYAKNGKNVRLNEEDRQLMILYFTACQLTNSNQKCLGKHKTIFIQFKEQFQRRKSVYFFLKCQVR